MIHQSVMFKEAYSITIGDELGELESHWIGIFGGKPRYPFS